MRIGGSFRQSEPCLYGCTDKNAAYSEDMRTLRVSLEGKPPIECPVGTTVGALMPSRTDPSGLPYIACTVNHDICSLSYPLSVHANVRLLTMKDPHGWRVYRRSLCFILSKTVREIFPEAAFSIEHSFGNGLFCRFHSPGQKPDEGLSPEQRRRLNAAMRDLIRRDLPIERRKIAYTEAVEAFQTSGQIHQLNLLRHRNPPHVVLHWCEGYSDLAHGPLAPSTGVLARFEILPYTSGFVLNLPTRDNPFAIPPFEDQPHLFQIFQEHKQWGRILGVNTVGRLNEIIAEGKIADFIQTAEALHEKKLAQIADRIATASPPIRLILIAGPSASGKTTFAKRLITHLRVNGLSPVMISTDDYFVGLDRNPRRADGQPDFEHLEAVDLELFNQDLLKLIAGETVALPRYNFQTKQREYAERRLRLESHQPLIVEGIHALNPRLTAQIQGDVTFRIYVSALTQLSLDSNNRLSTTDNRLMRRMVRDSRYRGHSALATLQLWPAVRQGEKRWIFPFQGQAHVAFNSALDYELAVLKTFVEPLLAEVKCDSPEYAEARRLSEFLLNFLPTSDRPVPPTSILREYIGGSSYKY